MEPFIWLAACAFLLIVLGKVMCGVADAGDRRRSKHPGGDFSGGGGWFGGDGSGDGGYDGGGGGGSD